MSTNYPQRVKEVDIVALENKRIIGPAGTVWDDWLDVGTVKDDFFSAREMPQTQKSEALTINSWLDMNYEFYDET